MIGLARFWLTSLALCAEDLASLALDGARWTHRTITSRTTHRPPGHHH